MATMRFPPCSSRRVLRSLAPLGTRCTLSDLGFAQIREQASAVTCQCLCKKKTCNGIMACLGCWHFLHQLFSRVLRIAAALWSDLHATCLRIEIHCYEGMRQAASQESALNAACSELFQMLQARQGKAHLKDTVPAHGEYLSALMGQAQSQLNQECLHAPALRERGSKSYGRTSLAARGVRGGGLVMTCCGILLQRTPTWTVYLHAAHSQNRPYLHRRWTLHDELGLPTAHARV